MTDRQQVADELRRRARGGARARAAPAGGDAARGAGGRGARPHAADPASRPHRGHAAAGQRGPQRGLARSDTLGGGGWRRLLARGLGRVLARVLDAQESFNSRQVQFDNALLDYIDARLQATHRHYDEVLGLHGRHMGEIDERHLILQEELVTHVHDLVRRIDLVLAEAERGRLGWSAICATCATGPGSSRSGSPRDEDGPGVRRPGAVRHGRGGDPGLGAAANLERRGFRADVAAVPFKWYPVSELVRQALAWRLLDVTESSGIRVDLVIPTKFPSFLVRHPRKVAWLFHQHREAYDLFGTPYCSFQDTPETSGPQRDPGHGHRRPHGMPRRVHDLAQRGRAAAEVQRPGRESLYPPPHHLGRLPHGRLRRLPLLCGPPGPPQAPGPRRGRHAGACAAGPGSRSRRGARWPRSCASRSRAWAWPTASSCSASSPRTS
jgi:hypothetical protein